MLFTVTVPVNEVQLIFIVPVNKTPLTGKTYFELPRKLILRTYKLKLSLSVQLELGPS